jgi:hypothetical protein
MCVVQAIPGAADVIEHLKAAGVPYKFVTNTTTDKRAGAQQRHHIAASQHAQNLQSRSPFTQCSVTDHASKLASVWRTQPLLQAFRVQSTTQHFICRQPADSQHQQHAA